MKHFFVFLFSLGLHFSLDAQNFRSGYIVTLKRDTVKGFLIDGTDKELSSGITFKNPERGNEKIEYRPADILSFGFENKRIFIRFSYTHRPTGGDSVFVFAKRMLEGKINLYTYNNVKGNNPDIFLVNNYSGQTVYLTEPEKLSTTDENGRTSVGDSFKHLGLIRTVKGDESFNSKMKKFKYSEKAIRDDISKYNNAFKDFPTSHYKKQVKYTYSVSGGIPFTRVMPGDVAYRMAFYINRYFPESSRTLSIITGISYRYWYNNNITNLNGVQNNNENFRQQWISLIPIGINFQTDSRIVKPYVYIGAGVAFLLESNRYIDNYKYKENKNVMSVTPTVNMGAGVRIKVGSKFIMAELSPTGNGSGTFINIGCTF